MPLAKLSRQLGGLAKLGRIDAADPIASLALQQTAPQAQQTPEQKYAVYAPFSSTGEVYIWSDWLSKRPGWTVQVPLGDQRISGSSRVDFIHAARRMAFYPEGTYWHEGRQRAQDLLKYARVKARGYTVVVFYYSNLEDCMERFPDFYRAYIGD